MKKLLHRTICMSILAGMACLMGGCYGSFPLVKALYEVNGEVTEHKLVHSIVFWVFVIFPVYEFAAFGDAIIFNLVEFWTGETTSLSGTTVQPDGSMLIVEDDGQTARLLMPGADGTSVTAIMQKQPDGTCHVLDNHGKLIGIVSNGLDGSLMLADADGTVIRTIAAAEVADYRSAATTRTE